MTITTPQSNFVAIVSGSGGTPFLCHSCGQPIRFFRTYPGDRPIPFNADALILEAEDDGDTVAIEYLDAADVHFRTCPDADRWRRPRVRR